ncbi:MAG: hypothetical protein H6722_30705 [Sandaracinus sp.]|nr:hypothetical protein [Myxococcales bacterium]MCB9599551.1 hypothetical protein [Sandaracinus sp.]MCB9616827.1 hypothetical protein [Sandaracinus sp.]
MVPPAAALEADDAEAAAAVEQRITQERMRLESSPFYASPNRPPHEGLQLIVGRVVAALQAGTGR